MQIPLERKNRSFLLPEITVSGYGDHGKVVCHTVLEFSGGQGRLSGNRARAAQQTRPRVASTDWGWRQRPPRLRQWGRVTRIAGSRGVQLARADTETSNDAHVCNRSMINSRPDGGGETPPPLFFP